MRFEDFHIHSNYSDGSDTPKEIMERASKLNIKKIALTDHDTISGLAEASQAAQSFGIEFVPGIELSVSYDQDRLLHILGLGIDPKNLDFLEAYYNYKRGKDESIEYVLTCLLDFNIYLTRNMLLDYSYEGYLDRHSIAKWLLHQEHSTSMQDSWVNYLDKIPYLEVELLSPKEAFNLIHVGGGRSYLAHIHKPIGLFGFTEEEKIQRLIHLKSIGLDGIESHYPSFDAKDLEFIGTVVSKLSLLECGGSDYHGKNRIDVNIGD